MANTLIDDGYFEEVFLLTPSQAEQLMRKNQLQQGSGKNQQSARFIKYGENQREINGQDDFPTVENDPLLTKLKTWEGLGADDVISQYHRYKQLDRLNKDYLQNNIPLPAGYTLDSIIVENKVDEEGSTPPQPKKKKTIMIPPPPTSSSSDDEETPIIKTRTEMKCPICPHFLNSGYTKKDGRYFMFCKGESCCMSYFDEGSVGWYVVKAKKDVLKKFKHPNPPIRCDCDVPTKLVWLRYNDNEFLKDRLFFICKVAKKDGGKCGFVLSAGEIKIVVI